MNVERIEMGGAGAGCIDAVVLQLRIPRQCDVGVGIVQRRDLALRDMMLDDGRARAGTGIDDDPRVRSPARPSPVETCRITSGAAACR